MRQLAMAAAFAAVSAFSGGAQAAVLFTDNFDADPIGVPTGGALLNWAVTQNTVDVIGAGSGFDFFPGNGHYIDLAGTPGPGTITSNQIFAAGTYTITFNLGDNARINAPGSTRLTLGSFSQDFTLNYGAGFTFQSVTFATTGGALSFSDLNDVGNPNVGNVLDNVTVMTGVPEPSTWAMMLVGFIGLSLAAQRRRKIAIAA